MVLGFRFASWGLLIYRRLIFSSLIFVEIDLLNIVLLNFISSWCLGMNTGVFYAVSTILAEMIEVVYPGESEASGRIGLVSYLFSFKAL